MRCEQTGNSGTHLGGRAGVDRLTGPGAVALYHITSGLAEPLVCDFGAVQGFSQ